MDMRLKEIEIQNIKNIKNGKVILPKTKDNIGCVLGIYGQNGSGKTAVIDVLYILQKLMTGETLDKDTVEYINKESETAQIDVTFTTDCENDVKYSVVLKRQESAAIIAKETLSYRYVLNDRIVTKVFMCYDSNDDKEIFTPKKRFSEVIRANKNIKLKLFVCKELAAQIKLSYIFNHKNMEIWKESKSTEFKQYAEIIESLWIFAIRDLFVIRNAHSGVISANLALPMAFKFESLPMNYKGDFAIPLSKPVLLDKTRYKIFHAIITQINAVISDIIPGLKLEIKDYGEQTLDSGEIGNKVELISVRDSIKIPIRMESEGIIKIISILNALIHSFGNSSVCLAIDELDAGIFEFLLGELLEVYHDYAKGQLIFTSHNLRALEVLDKENIVFSTANPENRFIRLQKVQSTNNLRDSYIRAVTLGGQPEIIYNETSRIKIAKAFRKANRLNIEMMDEGK